MKQYATTEATFDAQMSPCPPPITPDLQRVPVTIGPGIVETTISEWQMVGCVLTTVVIPNDTCPRMVYWFWSREIAQ